MKRGYLTYFWLLVVAAVVVGCASRRLADTQTPDKAVPTHELSARYRYLYTEALRQKLIGNHAGAFDLLSHCIDIDPEAPEAIYEMYFYRRALRQDSLALEMLRRSVCLEPRNELYLEALAAYYLEKSEEDSALIYVERLAELRPRRTDVLSRLVNLYSSMNRPADAISTLDRIETLEGKLSSISMRKFQLYKNMGRDDEAYAELEALCREYPHELNYRISIGSQLMDDGRMDEALRIFEEVRSQDPTNTALRVSMMLYHRAKGDDSAFQAARDSLIYDNSVPTYMRASLMRELVTSSMEDDSLGTGRRRVEQLFDSLDIDHSTDVELLNFKIAYLATYDKDNDSAYVATLERINAIEPSNSEVLFSLIYNYSQKQEFQQLENVCRRGVVTHPEELAVHYFLGMALYQQDKHEEALRAFQGGILQKTDETKPAMVADLYSIVGDIYHQMGLRRESYEAYDSCLTYQDDNATCLNNYAYYLSLENDNLDRAEEMSYRSIRLQPDNKTFLDTYAWILFMKERYAEAQSYIDRVCPPDSTDSVLLADENVSGVVFEHAGDIAACNGDIDKALRFWQLAQKAGGTDLSAVLPRKIKLRKYIKQ